VKIVLLDNIKGVGKVGDVKEVNDGYARNFLMPRGLGKPANASTLKEVNMLRAQKLEATLLEESRAKTAIEKLKGATITLAGKANAKGKLFSSISKDDIASQLSVLAGAHIKPDAIEADDQLKSVGTHTIHARIGSALRADITLIITAL